MAMRKVQATMSSDQSSDFEVLSEDDAGAQKGSKIYMKKGSSRPNLSNVYDWKAMEIK